MKKLVALLLCCMLLPGWASAVVLENHGTLSGVVDGNVSTWEWDVDGTATVTFDQVTINGYLYVVNFSGPGAETHIKLKGENVIKGGPCDDFFETPDEALLLEGVNMTLYLEPEEGASIRFEGTYRNYGSNKIVVLPEDCPTSGSFKEGNFVIGPRPTSTPVPTATPVPAPPATGDGANPALWLALSALMLAGVLTLRRRAAVR